MFAPRKVLFKAQNSRRIKLPLSFIRAFAEDTSTTDKCSTNFTLSGSMVKPLDIKTKKSIQKADTFYLCPIPSFKNRGLTKPSEQNYLSICQQHACLRQNVKAIPVKCRNPEKLAPFPAYSETKCFRIVFLRGECRKLLANPVNIAFAEATKLKEAAKEV